MTRITIDAAVVEGAPSYSDADIDRAELAASEVLERAGAKAAEAEREFLRQWLYLESEDAEDAGLSQDYECLTGLAAVWAAAKTAAEQAITATWYRPGYVSCDITAR